MKTLTCNNGRTMPAFGLGTWKSAPGEVKAAVKTAVEAGYRHLDCAWIYGNEAEIGEALTELFTDGVVTRDELWITSKLWNDRHAPEDVEPALRETLGNLRLDYLDLYLMHWPVVLRKGVALPESGDSFIPLKDLPLSTTWTAMEKLVDAGLTRSIGVSNFSITKLQGILDHARIKPVANQVELHPYLQQNDLVAFCHANDVILTAYSPLGSKDRPPRLKGEDEPVLLDDPAVVAIGDKHNVGPGAVLIAWALARGTSVIPKSVNPARIQRNLGSAQSVTLDDADMAALAALDRHRRYVDGSFWAQFGSPYSVSGLWDE